MGKTVPEMEDKSIGKAGTTIEGEDSKKESDVKGEDEVSERRAWILGRRIWISGRRRIWV